MVQIIHMKMGARMASKADYVLVEPLPGGKFTAQGSLINSHRLAFFNPSPFSSLGEAIASSRAGQKRTRSL